MLWHEHIFESLIDWVNTTLAPMAYIAFYQNFDEIRLNYTQLAQMQNQINIYWQATKSIKYQSKQNDIWFFIAKLENTFYSSQGL